VTIKQALDAAALELKCSDSPRLDAEILLAHVLGVERSYLFAHPEQELSVDSWQCFQRHVARRMQSEPIAYLVGRKSFWDFELTVNSHVLVPRPETELLVETALELGSADEALHVADLGTGSGAIALALARECPAWQLLAVDISSKALAVARQNAEALALKNVEFVQGSWCGALAAGGLDMIVSNPPYIAPDDPHLTEGDLPFEPALALHAADAGFAAFDRIAGTARQYLRTGGWLLLEHGFTQQKQLRALLLKLGYAAVSGYADLAGRDRLVAAQWGQD
jgi:release factor glutamine methyltransferase